ncbi:MAG: hypothetical protein WC734_04855 [Patescibacteria group bacterium]|jgi:hypothetical protein
MRFFVGRIWLAAVIVLMSACLMPFAAQATTWTADECITSDEYNYRPVISADARGDVHVVWTRQADGCPTILCKRLNNGSWSEDEVIGEARGTLGVSVAAGSDTSVHAVWAGDCGGNAFRVCYRRWHAGTWGNFEHLDQAYFFEGSYPAVAVDGDNNVHVIWSAALVGHGSKLYYRRWNGAFWTPTDSLADYFVGGYAIVSDSHDNTHIVWVAGNSPSEIRWKYRNETSWSQEEAIASSVQNSPSIAADNSGGIHLVWTALSQGVFHKKWDGQTWGSAVELFSYMGYSGSHPKITISPDDNMHVVMDRNSDYPLTCWDVWYTGWDGLMWSQPRKIVGQCSEYPLVASDPMGNVHVVWEGTQGNEYNIYHKMRKHCLDGDAFADCRTIGVYPSGLLFDTRYTANADTFPQPPDEPAYYVSTKVTVTRTANDRFFLSGDQNMLQPWIADDKVYVNGISTGLGFAGVVDPAYPLCRPIESVLQPALPRDVTDLIPMGESCVTFKLADTQRTILGNTRIYLVRQDAAGVADPFLSKDVAMLSVMPNPTQAGTALRLVTPQNGAYRASIQMADGRLVQGWPVIILTAGERHEWQWDGRNMHGQTVGPGVYFGTIQTPGGRSTKKILIVR